MATRLRPDVDAGGRARIRANTAEEMKRLAAALGPASPLLFVKRDDLAVVRQWR
jgi:hypothetical protein